MNLVVLKNTTPSSSACHPPTGGELPQADTPQPPRQASPATPPQEGNCLKQTRHNHPVKLRLPPLHRRGIASSRHATTTPSSFACHPSTGGELPQADTPQPPRQAPLATPPQEGNGPTLYLYRHATTTPSSSACHPSTGGEYHTVRLRRRVQTLCNRSSVSVLVISPPQEGNGPTLCLYRHATTTPSSGA